METKNKRNYPGTVSYYDGSAVRKLNTVPEMDREQERITRTTPRQKPKARRKPAINLFTFLLLTVAMGVTLYSGIDYLKVQIEISNLKKAVSASEVTLAKLTSDNDAALSEINTSLDLKEVFDVAMIELGMVFPNENQVVSYETAVSEYARQYDSVPEVKAEDLLEKLFK